MKFTHSLDKIVFLYSRYSVILLGKTCKVSVVKSGFFRVTVTWTGLRTDLSILSSYIIIDKKNSGRTIKSLNPPKKKLKYLQILLGIKNIKRKNRYF